LNVSEQNKDRVCPFFQHAPKIGYHSKVLEQAFAISINKKPIICSLFAESLVKISR